LILDEPTSSLDGIAEREVLNALMNSLSGKSLILVTHRLTGMETMDEILVLKEGRIIERGAHDDLMMMGGLYRRLWDLQHRIL
jgi:ATP-binding cassette subfamily C protein CydC